MKLKPLVRMMAMLPVIALPAATALHASDLSIYTPNSGGETSILLMLDTSGSMGISSLVLPRDNAYGSPGDVETSLCAPTEVTESNVKFKEWAYNAKPANSTKTAFKKTVSINGKTIDYYLRGCGTATVGSTGKLIESATGKFDRLSRLKDAVIQLLADQSLGDQVRIGLGHYSTKTNITVGSTKNVLVDGHSGKILVPVAELTAAQREKLITQLASLKSVDTTTNEDGTANSNLKLTSENYPNIFKSSSGTPAAHAYAEAGAYMMGTTTGTYAPRTLPTKTSILYDGYSVIKNNNTGEQLYYVCVGLDGKTGTAFGATSMFCDNQWNRGMDANYPGKFYDNNGPGSQVVIYKPNGSGGWTVVRPADYKNEPEVKRQNVTINNVWTLHKSLPVGWRWGGWLKVDNEPMDIEPIGAKVWDHHGSDTKNMVSYRSSPFSLESVNNVPYENMVGGFMYADSSLKDGSNYKAGGIASECNGNGIYFLTDGAPNSTKDDMAQNIMNLTLKDNTYKFTGKPITNQLVSPKLQASVFTGETGGWEYIGEYAKKLRNRTANSSTQKNPANMNIKTAVVGFGSSFADVVQSDGTYNCEAIRETNPDAYNACKWGSEEYGDGGFYYAENVEDIKNSIMDFVTKVQVPFTATSLGSISVPRDPLDQTQIVTEGFFPMISPMDDSEAAAGQKYMTWAGNLKKYKIVDGTLKDKSNNSIYTTVNNQQKINSTAQDLWSIASTSDDHSDIMSGGSLNKIPVPSLLNIPGQPSKADSARNVYTIDGTVLKKVTKDNIATDVAGTTALDTTNISASQRYALLNYLGYVAPIPTTTPTTLTTTQVNNLATVPASPYRYMGGVVHSTPVLATKEAKISSGSNTVESREEYVVYGSMEGGLHIVDASTGAEKSVFVPKEILANQSNALASKEPKGHGLVYGVDAPWTVDSQYKVKTTTSGTTVTTAYEASILRAYGGLRMGGVGFYGLDISTATAPQLLFHIDRSKAGFDRLAQIWSKPTITEIRHEGKRKRVLIFGGGYDADKYENETVESPTSLPTMGNALYVVDAKTGELIWSTSSSISASNDTDKTAQTDVKYSVVAQPAVRDYDSDGLADMIYFADLGGQIFRVDLNNLAHMNTTQKNITVRVQKIANLEETDFVPRFYDRVTTAVFGSGNERHVFVSVGSGNRSFPLKGSPVKNKVYGILDYDAAKNGIEKTTYTGAFQAVATMGTTGTMLNRGSVGKNAAGVNTLTVNGVTVTTSEGKTSLNDANKASLQSAGTKRGWYFELMSKGDGTPTGNFYAKAFEEPQLVVGDLYVSIYDPEASLGASTSSCGGGVQGLSTIHRICAPYGDCAAHVTTDYQGIIGSTLGGLTNPARTTQLIGPVTPAGEKCVGRCDTDAQTAVDQSLKKYSQRRTIRPTRWFEW
ncbi:pilus assembly protein [Acinetobacter terrae]|uniref:pilus assembly protein n=1 Tax=Acinetobacter terrae TaxID=2731247 RepID=UPI0007D84526|nr:PilC/PilY family type IV pilus protein [Acinetobacter terrae]OAL75942.1 hypothetical protein AY608_09680 [Acinetobacter terrae]